MGIPSDLRERALALPEPERAELANELLLSLELDGVEREPGYEEAWTAEIEARIKRFEADPSSARPVEEVFERLRQSLERARTR